MIDLSLGLAFLFSPQKPVEKPIHIEIVYVQTIENSKEETQSLTFNRAMYIDIAKDLVRKYRLNEEEFLGVLECENPWWDPTLQSYHKDPNGPNGRENSWGLAQIHLDSWNVSRKEATDPEFSLNFMATKFAKGEQHWWSCWHILYGDN